VQARGEVAKGIHTPTSTSITVAEGCERWLQTCEQKERSRSTLDNYRRIVKHHIVPLIGSEKLAKLTRPKIENYRDELLKRSITQRPMTRALDYPSTASTQVIKKPAPNPTLIAFVRALARKAAREWLANRSGDEL
jgi:hypothetical protein